MSRLVLVNYAVVERLIREAHGDGVPLRRFPYAPESAFMPLREHRGAAGAPPRIVVVSRHDPRKGIDVLLRALALLREQGVPFHARLAGPGPLLARHRELARELGLDPCVEVLGLVKDPLAELAEADVYVLPSREEQSGSLALLEAMQSGVAVVASGVDGILEDVVSGVDALLVAPCDAAALAGALSRVLTDTALRARLAAAARGTFETRFAAASLVDAIGGLYQELEAGVRAGGR
jgi:glycosyltransferase involved in cell wall biosynthesis